MKSTINPLNQQLTRRIDIFRLGPSNQTVAEIGLCLQYWGLFWINWRRLRWAWKLIDRIWYSHISRFIPKWMMISIFTWFVLMVFFVFALLFHLSYFSHLPQIVKIWLSLPHPPPHYHHCLSLYCQLFISSVDCSFLPVDIGNFGRTMYLFLA